MKRATKLWLAIGAVLVLVGCILFAGVMSMLKWDFTRLSTVKYETNTYEIDRAFTGISVDTNTADVEFVLSLDGKCRVECHEEVKAKHLVSVEEGVLMVAWVDNRSWYDYIGINIGTPKVTAYLPQTEYALLWVRGSTGDVTMPKGFVFGDISVALRTGDICVEHISAGSVKLSVTTGKITATGVDCAGDLTVDVSTGKTYLTDISCKNLTSGGSTGSISLKNVIAAEVLSVRRSTGDVKIEDCDAGKIIVKTDTGDVAGSLLTDKIFEVHTDTGRIHVPQSGSGGKCEITTNTGNINITVQKD